MDKENELSNKLLSEKIDHLKTITERVEKQNEKDHNSIIEYQKKQNGRVKRNTDKIDTLDKTVAKIRERFIFYGITLPILMGVIGFLSKSLLDYMIK